MQTKSAIGYRVSILLALSASLVASAAIASEPTLGGWFWSGQILAPTSVELKLDGIKGEMKYAPELKLDGAVTPLDGIKGEYKEHKAGELKLDGIKGEYKERKAGELKLDGIKGEYKERKAGELKLDGIKGEYKERKAGELKLDGVEGIKMDGIKGESADHKGRDSFQWGVGRGVSKLSSGGAYKESSGGDYKGVNNSFQWGVGRGAGEYKEGPTGANADDIPLDSGEPTSSFTGEHSGGGGGGAGKIKNNNLFTIQGAQAGVQGNNTVHNAGTPNLLVPAVKTGGIGQPDLGGKGGGTPLFNPGAANNLTQTGVQINNTGRTAGDAGGTKGGKQLHLNQLK